MNGSSFFRSRFFLLLLVIGLLGGGTGAVAAKPPKKIQDLTDSVLANRITTKFALFVRASNLASFMSSRGPFTLFAPTDSAFSKLPPGEMEALLQPENQAVLQRILLFHLVNGDRLSARDLLTKKTMPSCEGHPLTFRTSHAGAQFVQKARILRADIRCENGLIHEIDTVLIPPGLVLPPPQTGAPPATSTAVTGTAEATNSDATPTPPPAPAADTAPPPDTTNNPTAPTP
jgi:uncharacterized surface protein with fasciclin (FAS1) repeats